MRKIIIDSKQFQKLIKVIKEQVDGEYYKISPEDYLDLLKYASYNPKVTGIKKFGGKPLYITGKLKLTGSDNTMTNLGNVAIVDGDLDVSGVPLQTLGNVKVMGNLNISNTKISNLKDVYVKGWVHDYGTPIAAMRIRREELKKMGEAESRREDNDWGLDNPDIDMEGLAANALFNHLVSDGELNEIDEETKNEIKSKLEQYDEIQYRYKSIKDTATDEELESLEDEGTDLLNEIERLKEQGADVYSIIPTSYRSYNNTYNFEVMGLRGREYMVGLYEDMYKAAIEYQEQLLDEVGLDGLSQFLLMDNIDKESIREYIEEFYERDIRDYPEGYFRKQDFELTDKQEERKEELEIYINQMEDLKTEKEEELENTEDDDEKSKLENEIEKIEENIEKAQDEFDNIEPDDEPTEEMIEKKVKEYVKRAMNNPTNWLISMDMEDSIKDYVNIKGVARDVVDHDGMGSLSNYDGTYEEVYITGPDGTRHNFVIIRTQ
jgi:hypothetical protein